jgi:hypothetical protein
MNSKAKTPPPVLPVVRVDRRGVSAGRGGAA